MGVKAREDRQVGVSRLELNDDSCAALAQTQLGGIYGALLQ